jgi:hypothetical protein
VILLKRLSATDVALVTTRLTDVLLPARYKNIPGTLFFLFQASKLFSG